jgi:hypothetical protein
MTETTPTKKLNGLPPGLVHPSTRRKAMSTSMNRRAVLAGAASALPVIAASPAPAGVNADAELLELGARLEPIIQEWHAKSASDARDTAAWEEACIRAGLPRRELDSMPIEEWRQYEVRRSAVPYEKTQEEEEDENGVDLVWERILDRMWPLIDDILSQRAQTVAGLAVQARAFTLSSSEWWTSDLCENDQGLAFAEAVCAFTGVTPVALEKMPADV